MRRSLIVTLALLSMGAVVGSGAEAPRYSVVHRTVLGGEGGWDCLTVDPAAHRLYITRSTRVQIVDLKADSLMAEIPDTPGVHGVALVPDLGWGFISNGRDSSVSVVDLKTLTLVAKVQLPEGSRNPDVIVYDPESKRVFSFNGGSSNATAIDAKTHQVVGTVALEGRPEFAVPDGHGRMFVNLEDKSLVTSFDTRTLKMGPRWALAPGEEPTGLAFDTEHRRLFAACANHHLMVLDSRSGKVVADLPIGDRPDGAAFDSGLGRVMTSNGDGTLSVYHEESPNRFVSLGDIATQRGARTLAVDPVTHVVYTVTAEFGEPPAPTTERPHPRPPMLPGTFVVLTVAPQGAAPSP